jgi:Fe-S cluster assembly iron-binding protein IscA
MPQLAQTRLRISDRAQAKIRSILAETGQRDEAVRLFAEKSDDGGIELGLASDRRRDDDIQVPADGVTVIADAQTLAIVRDRIIDYEAEGFTFAVDGACEAPVFAE